MIPAGTPAEGEITDVRNKGMWGKSGKFSARLLFLTVNGRQIRLGGDFNDKGSAGGVGAVAVSALVFAPAGFFMTGKSEALVAQITKLIPLGRLGPPADLAGLVAFLASPDSGWVNGQVIRANGGAI